MPALGRGCAHLVGGRVARDNGVDAVLHVLEHARLDGGGGRGEQLLAQRVDVRALHLGHRVEVHHLPPLAQVLLLHAHLQLAELRRAARTTQHGVRASGDSAGETHHAQA